MSDAPSGHPLLHPDQRLLAALEQAVPADAIAARATDRLSYAHDASHYLRVPKAVVTPRSASDVAALLRTCGRDGTALTFRSGGTSLSGQASTDGVLVDTRRHFRGIEVLDGGARVRTGPGATVRAVNARLARHGRRLGPDPASEVACTVGGVVANNSSGMACGVHANTYRTLDSTVLVLTSGTVIDTSAPDADDLLRRQEPALHRGLSELRDRVRGNADSVATIERLYAIKNTMGYGLNSLVDFERPVDILEHLVIGSEGTLAFVAEATFRTVPLHPHAATGLLVFPTLADATASLPTLVDTGFATIELLDSTSLRVAQLDPRADDAIRAVDVHGHAALLVELQQDSAETLAESIARAERVLRELPVTGPPGMTTDSARRSELWRVRKGLFTSVAGNRPSGTTALLEDIAVPVDRLLPTCEALVGLFDRYGYEESVIFGHAEDGNVHFMLNERFDRPDLVERYVAFTEDMVELVLGQSGTLKAEHGTGRVMAPYVRRQYGDELYDVMREIKALADPRGVLNPGVLLDEDPSAHISHLKTSPTVETEVDRCVECGYCEPVCPSRDLTTTPRQRIVLRRETERARAAGDQDLVERLRQEYAYDGVDTCAVDGMCQTACPVLINTGDLVRRLRSEQAGRAERALWHGAARHWSGASRLAAGGLSAARRMPSLAEHVTSAARSLLGESKMPGWTRDLPGGGTARRAHKAARPDAVYFSACVTTMFGPADGSLGVRDAFLDLCARAGVSLRVPEGIGSLCCGTPWKSKGLDDGYAAMRERLVPVLSEATDGGRLPVVCDASSCTEGLTVLLAAAQETSERIDVIDAVQFADTVLLPRLPRLRRLGTVVAHPTCSSTQLGTNEALLRLAAAIADDVVVPDDWGCCGFAGDRGMLRPELTAAATAAEVAALGGRRADAYVSTNRTCELGMSRATGAVYRHVLELLDEAAR
ncbi:FAD-binding and (Fe-S)-binding domain-containing protein [Streptomyces sp. NPDC013978]|uniref:FAD-binding and (Fe-S)-binding domain-containing protein n=1 Tax=Streptomyces sp. NPDC013978 TaxID=3364869 RepID=UPI0036FD5C83